MSNLEEAKLIYKKYSNKLEKVRIKATCGDNEAAVDLIKLMTELNIKLKELGYRITDETEECGSGKLVLITEEWIEEQKKETKLQRLSREVREAKLNNSPDADKKARELMYELTRDLK